MAGGGDLYRIDLSPEAQRRTLPGDIETRGSIGGSDVGANPRDDQRVRDLIEEYMEQTQILQQLNFLNLNQGGGLVLLGGYTHETTEPVVIAGSGSSHQVDSVHTATVTLLGNPILVEWSCVITITWKDVTSATGLGGKLRVWSGVQFDTSVLTSFNGSWVNYQLQFVQNSQMAAGIGSYSVDIPIHGRTLLWNGMDTTWITNIATLLAAGAHVIGVSLDIGLPGTIQASSVNVDFGSVEVFIYDFPASEFAKISFPE